MAAREVEREATVASFATGAEGCRQDVAAGVVMAWVTGAALSSEWWMERMEAIAWGREHGRRLRAEEDTEAYIRWRWKRDGWWLGTGEPPVGGP